MQSSPIVLKGPLPWAFTKAELTAGLRRRFCDSHLVIKKMMTITLKDARPASGKIRGIEIVYKGKTGVKTLQMVLKEPHSSTRSGTAGAGKREVAFYESLAESVPHQTPELWAADREGKWLVMELLPSIRQPEEWFMEDYLLAVDKLVELHDRFWCLEEDMIAYSFLSRPLTLDKQIHLAAAENSLKKIFERNVPSRLTSERELAATLELLVKEGGKIAEKLGNNPSTLIHGDYWPGNLTLLDEGKLGAYDWQQTGVAPGILDLISLVHNSRWWLNLLPHQIEEIQQRYKSSLEGCSGVMWKENEWSELWDYGLMWRFLTDWVPLLSEIPEPVLETRFPLLEETWLNPVRTAISNRL
jgi:hypothetical protein